MNKLLIVTDAWHPQINGVVRSMDRLARELVRLGVEVDILAPSEFKTVPMPGYSEIRLAITNPWQVRRRIEKSNPDFIQIATEGPLGLMARGTALKRTGYTTTYHTKFPEYLAARLPVPIKWSYAFLRWFHNGGRGCMVATESLRQELTAHGFRDLHMWSRGVDTELFRPRDERPIDLPRPVFLHVGRIAVEKNVEAFLKLELPGSKLVVGGGPMLDELKAKYPNVTFVGPKLGAELAAYYAMGDVFVFPSLTDTFGNVVLEALSSGVPVAAYPVMGPKDIIGTSGAGTLDEDLQRGALAALNIPKSVARAHALTFSWEACARQFMTAIYESYQVPAERRRVAPPPPPPSLEERLAAATR